MTTGRSIRCVRAPMLRDMEPTRRHRRILSTALALLLAVESVAAVSVAAAGALTARSAAHALPVATPAGQVLAEAGTADHAWEPGLAAPTASPLPSAGAAAEPPMDLRRAVRPLVQVAPSATPTPSASAAPKATPKPAVTKPKAASTASRTTTTSRNTAPKATAVAYVGRNHVWMPSLGVNQAVDFFSCTRSAAPDNYVYRWGCAGDNNVYLLGHAYGVFKPLHDAYVNGRLATGMRVYYADGSGVVHAYSVQWWKLTRPTTDASWAWAAQSVPSMTLQTCVGANSEYRLMVRLVQVS
jgi:hypothetical protein